MLNQPSSIAELVSILRAEPVPVVFFDTCAILDVPRSLHRETSAPTLVQHALNALQALSATPPKLRLVICEQVSQEFKKNLAEVTNELQGRVAQISQAGNSLLSAADSARLGSTLTSLEAKLTALTSQIFDSCLTIATDKACVSGAAARLASSTAPAKRGSSNMGDCLVIEHFLQFVRQLRADGFGQPCIFVSSNYKDYGKIANPKAPLDSEFAAVSIDYMPDISAALTQLGF